MFDIYLQDLLRMELGLDVHYPLGIYEASLDLGGRIINSKTGVVCSPKLLIQLSVEGL